MFKKPESGKKQRCPHSKTIMARSILNLEILRGTTFGPITITCKDAAGEPVPLAGWSAHAHARRDGETATLIDFAPVIEADDADGLVTIPEIPWESTIELPISIAPWDLILQDPTGRRLPPFLGGRVTIANPSTLPE